MITFRAGDNLGKYYCKPNLKNQIFLCCNYCQCCKIVNGIGLHGHNADGGDIFAQDIIQIPHKQCGFDGCKSGHYTIIFQRIGGVN